MCLPLQSCQEISASLSSHLTKQLLKHCACQPCAVLVWHKTLENPATLHTQHSDAWMFALICVGHL